MKTLEHLSLLISEEKIQNRIKELAKEINEEFKNEDITAICVLKGAVMFFTDLVKYLESPLQMEFIRLSSYGSASSSSGKIHAVDLSLPNLNQKNVLIIEDIVDTGLTAEFLIKYINDNFSPKKIKLCSLLNKKCYRKIDIDADYIGFEVGDNFVVGYGLDGDGYYRNLPYIAEVK